MASTQLTKAVQRVGSDSITKMTYSVWIKRSALGEGEIFAAHQLSSYYTDLYFNSTDRLQLYSNINSSGAAELVTERKFRDVNAWYHIVLAVDTTLATASDRIKFYVNGVRETVFNGGVTYPSQGSGFGQFDDTGATLYIGNNPNRTAFSGSMSYSIYTPYTASDASPFGSTDSTTGEWEIKTSPTPTYSTAGFFILKDGNSVTDQSGNSNNFTVAAGTLTKTEDCPDNVFATLNPLARFQVAPTYSNGNNTITAGAGGSGSSPFSTIGASSGKYYAEFSLGSVNGGGISCGIIDITQFNPNFQTDAWFYYPTYGYAYISNNGKKANNNAESNYANSYTNGDKIGVAMDLDNNKLYFAKNGVWQNSGDPTSGATGTGAAFTIADGTYGFAVYGYQEKVWNANFGNGYFATTAVSSAGTNASGNGIFEYDTPTGFTALSTKGLNL